MNFSSIFYRIFLCNIDTLYRYIHRTQKQRAHSPPYSLSKKLRRIFCVSRKHNLKHLVSGRVPDAKYFSGCKCGICLPPADKLCAQQTAKKLVEKAEGLFRQTKGGHKARLFVQFWVSLRQAAASSRNVLQEIMGTSDAIAWMLLTYFHLFSGIGFRNSTRPDSRLASCSAFIARG